jgi:hypothetical protein
MFTKTRMTAAAALALSLSSLALASDAATQPAKVSNVPGSAEQRSADRAFGKARALKDAGMGWGTTSPASSCPKLEGYPDCH